jgi:hypothetical protein
MLKDLKNPKNFGYIFESILFERLKSLNLFDEIYYETDLRKKWGFDAASVDYLLVYKNNVIMLQVKWRKTRRKENAHIQNFIKSINHISRFIDDKTMLFGLWVSRRQPFDDNKYYMKNHNIYCISDFNSMTKLANDMEAILKNVISLGVPINEMLQEQVLESHYHQVTSQVK